MTYISSLNINTEKKHPFPYDVPAIKYAKNIKLHNAVTFFVGDNGTGKSTLIETIACKLELPHMLGVRYSGRSYIGVKHLLTHFEINFERKINTGFFFRAEDFGDLMNSVDKADANLHVQLRYTQAE